MIKVSLSGLNISEQLREAAERKFAEVDAEIGASTQEMAALAKRLAPKDQGLLVSEIGSFQEKFLSWTYVSQASYSAFLEFGTRSSVSIPPGLESFAAGLRGTVRGTLSAKEAIFNWCRRKGIDRKLWYAIFIKLMTKGVRPHPFFFPAFEQVRPQMLNRLQQIL